MIEDNNSDLVRRVLLSMLWCSEVPYQVNGLCNF